MLSVPLTGSGIDIDIFKELLHEHENIKGIICVPRHSNPTGDIYSDKNMSEIMEAGKGYSREFLFLLDHAYLLHDFAPTIDQTPSWELAKKNDVLDQTAIFCSFSKVTLVANGSFRSPAGNSRFCHSQF